MSYLGTVLHHDDRYGEAVRMLDDACAACRVGGLLRPMLAAVFFSVIARGNRGDLADALAAAGRLAVDVERYELDSYRARAHNAHAWLWRELGQPARSLEIAHQAREAAHLPDGYVEAEPAAHALLQVAESHLQLGDEAEAARWLAEITDATVDGVAFGWRLNLRRLEVLTRLQPDRAEELLAEATARGSIKYQALAWAALGHTDEAVSLAAKTGSDLLIAHVAADEEAAKAAGRVADRLAPDDRADFLQRGAWRMGRVAL